MEADRTPWLSPEEYLRRERLAETKSEYVDGMLVAMSRATRWHVLITTNNGSAVLLRNDQTAGNRSIRFRLRGTVSNRDAIGSTVRIFYEGASQSRMVKSGSSYLSQSELPVTFGVGRRNRIDRHCVSSRIEQANARSTRHARLIANLQIQGCGGRRNQPQCDNT